MNAETRFALGAAAGALNTLNARRPFARSGLGALPSFFAGWLTSELPLHTIAWQAAATALHARRHGTDALGFRAGAAVSAASWAGLAAIHRQATQVDGAFETAFRADLRDLPPSGPSPAPRPGQLVNPFASGRARYLQHRDVEYVTGGGRRNHLDVWRPAGLAADAGAPVLLQVHGGGWAIGNKEQQGAPLMTEMCDRGWVCVAINYRLSPRASWPDHIVDVKRAIAWTRENIARHGGDPDYIAITGGSAGGHLSALAALTPGDARFQPGFEDADTRIQAAVPFYGVYDFTDREGIGSEDMAEYLERVVMKMAQSDEPDVWRAASPLSRVHADAPPFLVIHGENDSLVPVEKARTFATALRAASRRPVVYAELPGTQHAFEVFGSVRTHYAVRHVGRFLDHVRAGFEPVIDLAAGEVTTR